MNTEQRLSSELLNIESRLQQSLRPVSPPAVFVADLRSKLEKEMGKKQKSRQVKNNLLIAGGILGAAALLITILRTLTSWEKLSASIAKALPKIRKREPVASI